MTENKNRLLGGAKEQEALQRHADYYVGFLMNPENESEKIYLEMGQIALAINRVGEELVHTSYHGAQVKMKFREIAGGFAEIYIPLLLRSEYTVENIGKIETAVQMVDSGKVNYPVNHDFLHTALANARKSLIQK